MARKTTSSSASSSTRARDLLQKLRDLRNAVPGFTTESSDGRKSPIRVIAALPNDFLMAASVAVESSSALKSATQFDSDAVRQAVEFTQAYESVADEAEAFAKGIRHTIAIRRAQAATDALQAYDIAKGLARKPDGAGLAAHIQDMRRTLGRAGHKRKPKSNSNEQAPGQP
jgi:hypothetical protein